MLSAAPNLVALILGLYGLTCFSGCLSYSVFLKELNFLRNSYFHHLLNYSEVFAVDLGSLSQDRRYSFVINYCIILVSTMMLTAAEACHDLVWLFPFSCTSYVLSHGNTLQNIGLVVIRCWHFWSGPVYWYYGEWGMFQSAGWFTGAVACPHGSLEFRVHLVVYAEKQKMKIQK